MTTVLCKIWRLSGSVSIKYIGENLFLFKFQDVVEKNKVLLNQPWSFNKVLLMLKNFDGLIKPEDVDMKMCLFWMQVYGLPLGLMNDKVGAVMGEVIGDIEDVDLSDDQTAWGHFL
ncbi:hypothetical protein REPUB_Repub20aG0093700 [Reevesia pubescens]